MFKYDNEFSFSDNTSHGEIVKRVKPNETVLEFGCATGEISKYLKQNLNCEVFGVEISAIALESAKKYLSGYLCCDIENYEWEKDLSNKTFDTIIYADVLEHLRDPASAIKRALPFLKDDGKIIFSVPNISHGDIIAKLIRNRFDYTNLGLLDDTHVHFFAKNNLQPFFDSCDCFIADLTTTHIPLGQTEQGDTKVNDDVAALLQSLPYCETYQFVGVAYKSNYAKKSNMTFTEFTQKTTNAILYYNNGDGFNENNILLLPYNSQGVLEHEIKVPANVKEIRLDPIESSGYLFQNLEFKINGESFDNYTVANAIQLNNAFIANTDDPQFILLSETTIDTLYVKIERQPIISLLDGAHDLYDIIDQFKRKAMNDIKDREQALTITAEAISKQADLITSIEKEKDFAKESLHRANSELETLRKKAFDLEKTLPRLNEELDHTKIELDNYKHHYSMAIEQRNAFQARAAELESMYSCIANSASWKITKPLRFTLDLIKKICKKITPIRLFFKFLKCLKQNGLKYTLRKIKDKLKHNKAVKHSALSTHELENQKNIVFERDIKFSVLVPLYNTPDNLLREMIDSVVNQTYANWELCLADGSDENHKYVETTAMSYAAKDPRVKYMRLEENLGISGNTNNCEKMATGDYIALLDHDDLIAPDALFENARAICETNAEVLYSDEDHLSMGGLHVNPFYKPDYSPDLLRSQMYICHFLVINKALFEEIGGFNREFDGSQDYDLMLRLSEKTDKICHIPKILYTWRECEGSTAANADAKPYAHVAGLKALDAHLKRRFGENAYATESDYTFVFDARFGTMKDTPKVSIIIPMKDKHELTDACVKSIISKSTYQNYEILILDNRSENVETFDWFNNIEKYDSRIKVHPADMEFNWSKINNHGINLATGDVYIFLNNDIEIISPDWIERLCENALRDDIGVVGPLLLYEDDTIQHAGVVVGFGGWADHVFKGMKPIHYGAPYVSPMVSRNVLAVTGACLAVSKKTIEKIGNFDENFIICGSDIELGIRAYEFGLNNKYLATVRLYHYESKSRDSYIPEQDFKKSYECYAEYRKNIDPYYNINLDINSLIPSERVADVNKMNFKNFLKRCPLTAPICKAIKKALMPPAEYEIPEVLAISPRIDTEDNKKLRINLLTPSVDIKHVFGGISTAIKLFESLRDELGCEVRIITTDAPVIEASSVVSKDYKIVSCDDTSNAPMQLVSFSSRFKKTIPIRENDIFVATGWWTVYTIKEVIEWQAKAFNKAPNPLIYMIQDYEPGFYPWSSRYMMAESTYKLKTPTYAIINSYLLKEFLDNNGYSFNQSWAFEPVLNDNLRKYLPSDCSEVKKKKQILIYGRPSTERNAFALLISGLKLWREKFTEASDWQILSAGEAHDNVDLGDGVIVNSCGKLSLEEYARIMTETYAGVSLMVSPHPSYPPLEMSTFGVKTITNTYSNKDMSNFNSNIVSLDSCSASDIADALTEICSKYTGSGTVITNNAYAKGGAPFGSCVKELANMLKETFKI